MNREDAETATLEGVSRRLATPAVVRASVTRIRRGRLRRAGAKASVVLLSAAVFAFGSWALLDRDPSPPDPAGPPEQITDEPLEQQLREAVESGDHRLMEALIDAGAYVDQAYLDREGGRSNDEGVVNLGAFAMRSCDTVALGILDDAGASRSLSQYFSRDAALRAAIAYCDVATFDAVMDGTDGTLTRKDIAKVAADTGNLELMGVLAERGYPLENPAKGWSTIEDAASEGRTDMVLLLLDLGADPTVWHEGMPLVDWLRVIEAPPAAIEAVDEAADRWDGGAP